MTASGRLAVLNRHGSIAEVKEKGSEMERLDRIRGCLLAGAAGDALGAAVEFMDWASIRQQFGVQGIRDFVPAYGKLGAITDDTQMMLFTAEGLLRANVSQTANGFCDSRAMIHQALLRWYLTQGGKPRIAIEQDGWLIAEKELWSRRAPGMTCMSALGASKALGEFAHNDSKGCGGVMRVAPHAFFPDAFDLAADNAHLTHGHPSGYQASGLFADILRRLDLQQCELQDAIAQSLAEHGHKPGMEETRDLVEYAVRQSKTGIQPTPEGIAVMGGGWVAEEALGIGLWCALMADSLEQGVCWAVNHSGDSDSTGLIAGNLLGIQTGTKAIPQRWLKQLELREVIEQVASDIDWVPQHYCAGSSGEDTAVAARYPAKDWPL